MSILLTFTRFVIQTQRDAAVTTPPISNPTTPKVENKVELTSTTIVAPSNSRAKQEKRELEEAKRKLDEENRKIEAARQVEARRIEQQRRIHQTATQTTPTGDSSKKAIGIAVAVLAVAAVVLILVLK